MLPLQCKRSMCAEICERMHVSQWWSVTIYTLSCHTLTKPRHAWAFQHMTILRGQRRRHRETAVKGVWSNVCVPVSDNTTIWQQIEWQLVMTIQREGMEIRFTHFHISLHNLHGTNLLILSHTIERLNPTRFSFVVSGVCHLALWMRLNKGLCVPCQ